MAGGGCPEKSKINIPLLRKVEKKILAEPAALVMASFLEIGEPGKKWDDFVGIEFPRIVPPCGTMACIAGWTNIMGGKKDSWDEPGNAQQLLGLTDQQRFKLFYLEEWPHEFAKRWGKAKTL